MYNKITLVIILFLISYIIINKLNIYETFDEAPPYVKKRNFPSTQEVIPLNKITNEKQDEILKSSINNKIPGTAVNDYNQLLIDDTKDLVYYQNDIINQSNIYEDDNDIINQITELIKHSQKYS